MKPLTTEKLIAYLTLFSGLSLSIVAEFYSIAGLTAIFAAAVVPAIVMGVALGLGKVIATVWLKQNWDIAHWSVRAYLSIAIVLLMVVTSMGTFGFLSKAHSDQSLVSGDVMAKISVYDEKIKTAKDNIDANRKALKQMDEAVDQSMARSNDEKGADKAVAVRRSQQKERARLQSEIQAEQKTIAALSEERAPIAAEVRKVEAEVGPIKYIAAFVYGDTDPAVLEKAVTWVIILIITVFDPLAIILLLSSQISFQRIRELEEDQEVKDWFDQGRERARRLDEENAVVAEVADIVSAVPEALIEEQNEEGDSPVGPEVDVVSTGATVTQEELDALFAEDEPEEEKTLAELHPYLNTPFVHFSDMKPMPSRVADYEPDDGPLTEEQVEQLKESVAAFGLPSGEIISRQVLFPDMERPGDYITPPDESLFVQNEEQKESNLWTNTVGGTISQAEYLKQSRDRREEQIAAIAEEIKAGNITLDDISSDLRMEVRTKL